MQKLRVTVNGKVYEVEVELLDEGESSSAPREKTPQITPEPVTKGPAAGGTGEGKSVVSPLSAEVISIEVSPGQKVKEGQTLMILEAMKMNSHVSAPREGTVENILVKAGDAVEEGQDLLQLK